MVIWDFDSGDSTGSTPDESNAAYDALAKQHPSNVLALNHEVFGAYILCQCFNHCLILSIFTWYTAEQTAHVVVPHAIKTLKAAGYKLVTVAECLGLKPYQSIKAPENVSHFSLYPLVSVLLIQFSRALGHVNWASSTVMLQSPSIPRLI